MKIDLTEWRRYAGLAEEKCALDEAVSSRTKSSVSTRQKKEAAQDAFIESLYALPLSSFGHVRSEGVYTLVKSIKLSDNPRYNKAALVARFKAGGRSVRFLLGVSKGEDIEPVRPLLKGFKPVKKSALRFSDSHLNPPSSHVWLKVVRVKVPPLESAEDVAPLVKFVKDKVLPSLTDLTEWRQFSGLEEAKLPSSLGRMLRAYVEGDRSEHTVRAIHQALYRAGVFQTSPPVPASYIQDVHNWKPGPTRGRSSGGANGGYEESAHAYWLQANNRHSYRILIRPQHNLIEIHLWPHGRDNKPQESILGALTLRILRGVDEQALKRAATWLADDYRESKGADGLKAIRLALDQHAESLIKTGEKKSPW